MPGPIFHHPFTRGGCHENPNGIVLRARCRGHVHHLGCSSRRGPAAGRTGGQAGGGGDAHDHRIHQCELLREPWAVRGVRAGQNAELADSAQATTDKVFTDGDVRNTRINFTFAAGPVLGKWFPRATLESDFFGAFNGNPPFGDEQPQMRIRFAYVDLTNGRTTLRIGQFWSPMFGEVPVSVTHLAFPLGYGATGMVGWRFPGVFVYHDVTPSKPLTVQVQLTL